MKTGDFEYTQYIIVFSFDIFDQNVSKILSMSCIAESAAMKM